MSICVCVHSSQRSFSRAEMTAQIQKQFGIMQNWSGLWQITDAQDDVIFYRLLNQDVKVRVWESCAELILFGSSVRGGSHCAVTPMLNGWGGQRHAAPKRSAHQAGMEKRALAWTVDLVVMRSKCNDLMWLKKQNKGSAGTFAVMNSWRRKGFTLTPERDYFVSYGGRQNTL